MPFGTSIEFSAWLSQHDPVSSGVIVTQNIVAQIAIEVSDVDGRSSVTTPTSSYVRGCSCEATTRLSQCYPFVFAVVAEHVRSAVAVEVSNQESGATMATPFHVLVPRSPRKAAVGFGQGDPLVASAIVAEHVRSAVAVKVTEV